MRMKGFWLALNALLFLIAGFLCLGLQCSLWLQTLGGTPAPHLWIPFLVYFAIYRQRLESILGIYGIAAALSSFSAAPFGLLLVACLLIYFAVDTFKQRIFWGGVGFFSMVIGAVSFGLPFVMLAMSWIFDKNAIRNFPLINPIISALLTILSSFPLYGIFSKIDRLTSKELPAEAGRQTL